MPKPTQPEFSRTVQLATVERKHKTHKIEANKEECDALAKRFSLLGLEYLKAECEVWRARDEIFYIKGTIEAHVTQECVVTFVPVDTELVEEFDEKFCTAGYTPDEGEDDLEELTADELDLGEIVAQYLSLSLNQYPRAVLVE